MSAKEINDRALDNLAKQSFREAQALFFENARRNPSHETYNNLGFYLITEGLECKNGKIRSALKLGMKYLLKAHEIKVTSVNTFALLVAIERKLRCNDENKNALYKYACELATTALSMEYSPILEYEYLVFSYMLNANREELLDRTRKLIKVYPCAESLSLYFELIRLNGLVHEGLECIGAFSDLLEEIDLLMFYSSFELYDKAKDLCKTVFDRYYTEPAVIAAIVECYDFCGCFAEVKQVIEKVQELYINGSDITGWSKETLDRIREEREYRKALIGNYRSSPPLILDSCCYFGCHTHKTEWNN